MSQYNDSIEGKRSCPQRDRITIRRAVWIAMRPLVTFLLVWSSGNWFDRYHWWETWEAMR
jgi:hypothetical protein